MNNLFFYKRNQYQKRLILLSSEEKNDSFAEVLTIRYLFNWIAVPLDNRSSLLSRAKELSKPNENQKREKCDITPHSVSGRVENLSPSRSQDRKCGVDFATTRDTFCRRVMQRDAYLLVLLSSTRSWTAAKFPRYDLLAVSASNSSNLSHYSSKLGNAAKIEWDKQNRLAK